MDKKGTALPFFSICKDTKEDQPKLEPIKAKRRSRKVYCILSDDSDIFMYRCIDNIWHIIHLAHQLYVFSTRQQCIDHLLEVRKQKGYKVPQYLIDRLYQEIKEEE